MHIHADRERATKTKQIPARDRTKGRYRGEIEFSDGMTCERVIMTPSMAQRFLDTLYEKQRPIKQLHLAGLTRDVVEGRWIFNGQPVIIDDLGHLIDGQHRCTVCVQTGISLDLNILRGVPSESYESIDNIGKRSGSDAIRLRTKNAVVVASALVLLYKWDNGIPLSESLVASPTLVAEMLEKHPDMAESGRIGKSSRHITKSPGGAAFSHYLFSRVDEKQADSFMETVIGGENIAKGNPIYALRHRLLNEERELRPNDVAHYLIMAWNAWRQKREVFVLKTPAPGTKIPTPI